MVDICILCKYRVIHWARPASRVDQVDLGLPSRVKSV